MSAQQKTDLFESTYGAWERLGESPFFPIVHSNNGFQVNTSLGQNLKMFGSCDYLGLSQREELAEAAIRAIRDFGTNTYGAQLLIGHTTIHHELEERLSGLHQKYDALLFPSGMSANLAVISELAGEGDVIITDRKDHISIFMGATLSGAQVRSFAHNDMDKLESILQQSQDKNKRVIIVDGLYSADGDFAPMHIIDSLAKQYDAIIIVDEAHSFGIIGESGLGTCELFSAFDCVSAIVGTMSKALGSTGGFVLADPKVIRKLKYLAPSYTSSRGNSPATAAASLAALQLLSEEGNALRAKLAQNVDFVLSELSSLDFNTLNSVSHIVPLVVGEESSTVRVANFLANRGIFTATFLAPHVPKGLGRLRIGLSAAHSLDDCKELISTLVEIRQQGAFS
ncbi:8-amino-7-oxononanoate synthase [Aurantimicrobium minutum]|uniref:aminotransferase class I/II-fold pyridoxal phosphate-dependent enzyme n=1 Tax=Aurantimicrobium minutum TaxID=708131 RepID=UPI002406E7DC|nr:pyridoxal phosphate-dependent aminotransferase family protein [Aurantimicrobium minutum]MDF9809181.1 8-amino-7-oxononanoate synthase [Aurantimicrobium minutum]